MSLNQGVTPPPLLWSSRRNSGRWGRATHSVAATSSELGARAGAGERRNRM